MPRSLALPTRRNRDARNKIVAALDESYRPRQQRRGKREWWEIDFPKTLDGREAKERVIPDLDRIDRKWRRLFVLYPNEEALRRKSQ